MSSEEEARRQRTFYVAAPGEDDPAARARDARANIVRIHDVHPNMTRRFYDLFTELMYRPGPLARAQREMIAVVVASENGCHY